MREREIHLSTIDWQFVSQFYEHIKTRTKQSETKIVVLRERLLQFDQKKRRKEIEMTYEVIDMK